MARRTAWVTAVVADGERAAVDRIRRRRGVSPGWLTTGAARVCLLAALGLLTVGACAPAARPPAARAPGAAAPSASGGSLAAPSGALQTLIDGARQEGALTLAWGSIEDSDVRRRLAEGFNKAYGLNVAVQWSPGLPMPQMATKVAQEYQANRAASSDVVLGSETHVIGMLRADALATADWTTWAQNVRDPRLVAPNGVAVQFTSRTPGITYNASRLTGAAVPTTMQDLLKPQLKGRIASTVYAANFDRLASPDLWGKERTLDYVAKLADQAAGLIRCGEAERVASGEFDLLAIDCGGENARAMRAKGAPLDHAIPSDVALLSYWYLSVPKNAPHPNAAKLFVDYLLGREGQDLTYESDFVDHHLVPGSKTAPEIEKLQASGLQFTEINVQFVQRHDEQAVESIRTDLQNALQKK